MEDNKKCKQCNEIKDKNDFSGRSLRCKYCTNQNSIKIRIEKAISEGKEYKYRPILEYDPNKNLKICTKCEENKELSEFYINNSKKDGYTTRCKKCLCRKKVISDEDLISKICKICVIRKDLSEFPKDNECRLGHKNHCKECYYKNKKKYNENRILLDEDKLRLNEYQKNYREENKDIINEYQKNYREENKDIINDKLKEYYVNNKDKIKLCNYLYRKNNKEIILKRNRSYTKNRRKTDIVFSLKESIRTSIGNSFRNSGYKKSSRTYEILGCSFEDFKLYLESKFEYWMTWNNKGLYNGELNYGWDIDHIIPISSANTEEDITNLNHYTNLRPLCSFINRNIKRDKLEY